MGEHYGWKMQYGTINQIHNFEQEGKTCLRKFSEIFYWTFKNSQVVKKGYGNESLAQLLIRGYSECRKAMSFYMLGAVFFIDIDAQTSLESLNRIYNVLTEMADPNSAIISGLTQIFLGFAYRKLNREMSSNRAFIKAAEIFPKESVFHEFTQDQIHGETSFKEWISKSMKYFGFDDGSLLTKLTETVEQINMDDFNENEGAIVGDVSVEDYEKKFLKQYNEKKLMNKHVRRCQKCNYFIVSDDISEKRCPQCNSTMVFALYCPTCGIWYSVKTPKKYLCPTCGNLLEKKEKL
jgi:predicted Zn-ribbon and HTH transcriptional regulator